MITPGPLSRPSRLKQLFLFAILALPTAVQVVAEPHKEYPAVEDTSYVEKNGDRVIRLSVDVKATPEAIWNALSTPEGWKSYAVAFAIMEMKVGGIIETSYSSKAQPGDPDNIKNEIVAYIPGRMMAIRCVQAPRNFKHKEEFFSTASVFEVVPLEAQKTRVVVTAVGYRPGEAFDDLFRKFRRGDAYTLEKLRAHFDPKPDTAAPPAPAAEGGKPVPATPPKLP
jgi:uncharacterized protein YndB with AHSA1/START domain